VSADGGFHHIRTAYEWGLSNETMAAKTLVKLFIFSAALGAKHVVSLKIVKVFSKAL
jgi:hypothetical protein